MADKQTSFVATPIKAYAQFKKDKNKNKKIVLSLFEKNFKFAIHGANNDGKFNTKPECDVYLQDLAYNEDKLLTTVEEILARIVYLYDGSKSMESTPIIWHNGKPNYDTATSVVIFDCYTNEKAPEGMHKTTTLIQLKKKPEGSDKFTDNAVIYFSMNNTSGLFYKGESPKYSEAYSFFNGLRLVLLGMAERANPSRTEHWIALNEKNKGNNNSNNSNYKSKPEANTGSDINDDDDYPF